MMMQNKNIYILCDSTFLNNSSGINTFVVNLYNLLADKYNVYILTDKCFLDVNSYLKYQILYVELDNISMNNEKYIDYYSRKISDYILSNINHNDKNIFVANSLATLKTLDIISNTFINSKFLLYTHIGDLLCDDIEYYDFPKEDMDNMIKIINQNKKIVVGTQSYRLAKFLKSIFEKVVTLYEPIIQYNTFSKITAKFNNILVICSNYRRKRLDLVIKYAGELNIPLKILCTKRSGYYDLQQLATKHNTKLQILENIPNKDILFHIITSKMLIHFSEIEFFPYSILECASYIPCLINSNTIWGKLFPDFVNKVSLDDTDDNIKKRIVEIFNNGKPQLDIKDYMNKCEEQWVNFIHE